MAPESADPPASPSTSSPATSIPASQRDVALAASQWLSRREVIERRSRRARELALVYRRHYWAIMEELRAKHREYYWTFGKSPFKDDENREPSQNLGLGSSGGDDLVRCHVSGCKTKAMALTKFCYTHILSDPNQKLYKGCTYVIKSLYHLSCPQKRKAPSMQSGPLLCCKPILRTAVPLLCPSHLQKGEKCLMRDLRKAGLNVSSLGNLAPKFHVIITEYVCQIQAKRRAAQKNNVCKVEPK